VAVWDDTTSITIAALVYRVFPNQPPCFVFPATLMLPTSVRYRTYD